MSQATLSHGNPVSNFTLENALPWLRTLIDMLLVLGGALAATSVFSFFMVPNGWKMAVYQAGGLASAFAGATLVISTARTNQLQQRQTAQICIATPMLFMGGLLMFASQALPHTECLWYINIMTTCVAIWGLVCLGLILIERRIITQHNLNKLFRMKAGVSQTLWRIIVLAMTFFFSISFLMIPYTLAAFNGQAYLERIFDSYGRYPSTIEFLGLSAICIWIALAKSLWGWCFLWPYLNLFHSSNAGSLKSLFVLKPSLGQRLIVLFVLTGFLGYLTLTTLSHTTKFGISLAPWILAVMIGYTAFGYWKILQKEHSSI